jgi:hypothetical protein
MALTLNDKQYRSLLAAGTSSTQSVTTVISGATGNFTNEKALISVTGDPVDTTVDLTSGTISQIISRVHVSIPGATGDIIVSFYDDTPATILLATFYLANIPPDGFIINKAVASGSLGIRIAGVTNPTKKAYLNIAYGY